MKADTSPFVYQLHKLDAPKPRNDVDLAILSKIYFGVPLSFSELSITNERAAYKVAQPYDDYHGKNFRYDTHCIDGYDHSEIFWEHVVGRHHCSGIAKYSYGQVEIHGHRDQMRIKKWVMDRRKGGLSGLTQPFIRLAGRFRIGESDIITDNGRTD